MAGLSDYSEIGILNAMLRGINFTAPATNSLRLALFFADPTDAGTVNEISGAWYGRTLTGVWGSPSAVGNTYQTSNVSAITFQPVTGSPVTVTHIGIFDAAAAGNMLFSAPLTSSKTLQIGDVLSFAGASIVIQLD